MQGLTDETVGSSFNQDSLLEARNRTLEVITSVAAQLKPGMSEKDARALVLQKQTELGAPKSWHPPQIRFGVNSILPFGAVGEDNVVLKENDIFFLDLGPLFDSHEGDVGRAFAIGNDPDMHRCCKDAEAIWHQVRKHWQTTQATGAELYKYATTLAENLGWELLLKKANGHRISDFPHIAKRRGSVEGFEQTPQANRWILEIQIRHKVLPYGAFYEDLLN